MTSKLSKDQSMSDQQLQQVQGGAEDNPFFTPTALKPHLTIVAIPSLSVDDVDVDFTMDETKVQTSKGNEKS